MKKVLIASMALGATLTMASVSNADIATSLHNFSTWANGEICLPCHTPHNARGSYADAGPLWNHQLSTQTYTLYTSPTFDGTATVTQPASSSKACLSCHDGTVALDAFGYNTDGSLKTTGSINITNTTAVLGTNLSNDHPISFDYVAAQTLDNGIRSASTATGIPYKDGSISQAMLFGNMMECGSCHDVHNKYGITSLLKKSNAASALCLTCHIK